MKIPKKIKTYCPKCKKHTLHSVRQMRKGKTRALSWGQRQFRRVTAGYGSQPRSEQKRFAKTNKKITLVLKCETCGKSHHRKSFRSKKFRIGS
jgi:large subunit ribosomal protein L44e